MLNAVTDVSAQTEHARLFAGVPQHTGVPGGVAGAAGGGPLPAAPHGHPAGPGDVPRLAAATCALSLTLTLAQASFKPYATQAAV